MFTQKKRKVAWISSAVAIFAIVTLMVAFSGQSSIAMENVTVVDNKIRVSLGERTDMS
ncbi:hypothetical protein FACS189425_10730 [Clostridia bacterium]|nr:hypothetical protein FACS189425_10730 [Clostridia bacterium]